MTISRAAGNRTLVSQALAAVASGICFALVFTVPLVYPLFTLNPELSLTQPPALVAVVWVLFSYLILGVYAGLTAFLLSLLSHLSPKFSKYVSISSKPLVVCAFLLFYWGSQWLLKSPYYAAPRTRLLTLVVLAQSIIVACLSLLHAFRLSSLRTLIKVAIAGHLGVGGAMILITWPPAKPSPAATPPVAQVHRLGVESRLCLIGLDGLSWNVAKPLMAQGSMPVLDRLVRTGYANQMQILYPMKSPLLWTSIATGKGPDKHGIEDFEVRRVVLTAGTIGRFPHHLLFAQEFGFFPMIPLSSQVRKVNALWNILTDQGLSSITIGWWASWPAERVKGIVISDRLELAGRHQAGTAKSKSVTYPESLFQSLLELLPGVEAMPDELITELLATDADARLTQVNLKPVKLLRNAWAETIGRLQTSAYLAAKYNPDFLAVYVTSVDHISHVFWRAFEPQYYSYRSPAPSSRGLIPWWYSFTDSAVDQLLCAADPQANFLIVSDHGFGPATPGTADRFAAERYEFHSGIHRPDAFFMLHGPDCRKGSGGKAPHILELTPTLLQFYGLPVADDMDGQPRRDLLAKETAGDYPRIASYEQQERHSTPEVSALDEELLQNLEELGYIR